MTDGMKMIRAILSALALWASSAHAFIDPPVITPAHPTTQTPVVIAIRAGGCDNLLSYDLSVKNGSVDVTIQKLPTQLPPLCINPIEVSEVDTPLLAEGQHPLQIYLQDINPPGTLRVLWFETTLTIAPAGDIAPAPVPTTAGYIPATLLLLGLILLAAR